MEKSDQPVAAPEIPSEVHHVLPASSEKEHAVAHVPEKEDTLHWMNKMLKVIAYPIAAVSGWWAFSTSIGDSVYHNLKRYHFFDDIISKWKPENELTVKKTLNGIFKRPDAISATDFRQRSLGTKEGYMADTNTRMEYLGLGKKLSHFPARWKYVSDEGRSFALIQGMTVAGIAIGALLTIANSKALIEVFSGKEENQENSR